MPDPQALFISHGAPTYVYDDVPARDFLCGLGKNLPRPDAILCVTAHWETDIPTLSATPAPKTVHNFGGFTPDLYQIEYSAPGSPNVARQVATALDAGGIEVAIDGARGFDHGTWVPLAIMYPDADIPVVQLSVQPASKPETHFETGRALSALMDQNILVIGSGGITHNLREFGKTPIDGPLAIEAKTFADWWHEKASDRDTWSDLMDYREKAPHAEWNHPTCEHILPFYTVLGTGNHATRLHSSDTYGMLAMDVYGFR